MGLFPSARPSESADPRPTLRHQVGGTVEILVRTATLATFRYRRFSATIPVRKQSPGEARAAKSVLLRLSAQFASNGWRKRLGTSSSFGSKRGMIDPLVLYGCLFGVVDYECVKRNLAGLQSEAQLFLQGGEG